MKKRVIRKIKICLASSSGGHFTQLMKLKFLCEKYNYFFVTIRSTDTNFLLENEKVYFVELPQRRVKPTILNFLESLAIFLKEKPDLVISTGADATLFISIISRIAGKKLIYIETMGRFKRKTLTGKLLYYFSNRFFVQWESSVKLYGKKAEYWGSLY
ncbi:hypothetical protein A3K63_00610 [Candidatus Micrarchaeota archaeon RBG_16_49_10]|nr:MAG: hypothetical protein A3K63_00610 [Candidatus Micrarchaeota archaeon RBG_16_49_10]